MEWHCAEDLYLCVYGLCVSTAVFLLLSTMAAIITKTLPGPCGPHQYQKDSIREVTVDLKGLKTSRTLLITTLICVKAQDHTESCLLLFWSFLVYFINIDFFFVIKVLLFLNFSIRYLL